MLRPGMPPGVQSCTRAELGFAVCSHASISRITSRQGFKGELRHWDVTYAAERLREARYQLTDEQLRPYFALPNVLDGLFQAHGPAGHISSAELAFFQMSMQKCLKTECSCDAARCARRF